MRWYYWLLLLAALFYAIASVLHWDDRGALWVLEQFESQSDQNESVWLPNYRVVIDAKPMPGLEKVRPRTWRTTPRPTRCFRSWAKTRFWLS